MSIATSRVGIDLIHQMSNGMDTITDHLRGVTPGGCNQLIADHQHAVVMAGDVTLNQDIFTDFSCNRICGFYLFTTYEIY